MAGRGRRRALVAAALVAAVALLLPAPAQAAEKEKEIAGWVEWVVLTAEGLDGPVWVKAKLDTGAETSSLDATHVRRVRVGERRYVRFTITDPETGEATSLRRPLLRRVRIKQHEGSSQVRPVVALAVCLGGQRREVEFSLIDRSEFIYPVLLGRRALEGRVIVDPEVSFLLEPECEGIGGDEEDDGRERPDGEPDREPDGEEEG